MKPVRDRYGREVEEFDLLKVFHFIGTRRKKCFMYKWVVLRDGQLFCLHLDSKNDYSGFRLSGEYSKDIEIVQSNNWEKLEKKNESFVGRGLSS